LNKVVAVVGRPNVGKSTFFNRIIRRREAIVDDVAGITRDRKYAEAEWEGVHFTLIDTGGYLPKAENPIDSGVAHQVRLAMEEADLVMLVVDVTSGITDEDFEVAELLRKNEQKTVLVVNKVDGQNREYLAAEFARLGIPDMIAVSALGGRNMGDCLSLVLDRLGREPVPGSAPVNENEIKLAIVGRPNTGKSTFINTMLGEERMLVTDVPGTTRDAIDIRLEWRGRSFLLVDTAGLRKKSKVEGVEYYSGLRTRRAIEEADVAAVFCDAAE
jgi:GTP-binding protein